MKKLPYALAALLLALTMLLGSCTEGGEETTVAPETTSAPETTKAPETTSAPETTATPEVTTEPPHVHSWSKWSVTKAATCTEAGSEERNCACGEKETKPIAALGHSEVVDKAVAPTCTADGKTEGKHCSVCNTVTVKQTAIKATGHSYKNGVCSSCGKADPSAPDPEKLYNEAIALLDSGKYEEAYGKLLSIKDKKDVSEYLERFVWVCGKETYTNASGAYKSVTVYTINKNGYVTEARESDNTGREYITQYLYETDKGGRLLETARWLVGTDDNTIVEYVYDSYGNLVEKVLWFSFEDAEYKIIYEYDNDGRLVKEINNNFNMPYTVEYSYGSDGKLTQSATIDAFGTTVTKYEYDKNGLLVKESTNYYDGDGSVTYEYDENGNLIKMTEHTGVNTVYSDYKLYYRSDIIEDVKTGTLSVITEYNPEWISWSNGAVTAIGREGKYYVIDNAGKIVAGPFDSIVCPDLNGYSVGFVYSSEVVGTDFDFDGSTVDVVKKTTKSYVLDSLGKVVFETTGSRTDSGFESVYEGEYVENCSEGRIITVSYSDYIIGMARNDFFVNVYDMNGNKIAVYEDIFEVGSYINGELVMVTSYSEIIVADANGNKISVSHDDLKTQHPKFNPNYLEMYYPYVGDGHHMASFTEGYAIIEVEHYWGPEDFYHLLISRDLTNSYLIKTSYLNNNRSYGTLVFSKIVENGKVSDGYYLIDVSKCAVDENGMVIPSRSAALCDKEFASGSFYNIFGQTEKYALVSTSDGKWGFLSMDGKTLKMYDDASYFSGGYAVVKDGGEIYVIDEDFNRVSDAITGYDSVSVAGNGVFVLKKDGKRFIAVYSK